jgi:hypothetical protein
MAALWRSMKNNLINMNTVKNHHSLNEIFNNNEFPSVLNLPDMMSAEELSEQPTPTPEQWKSMFCGISPQQSHPMNVCLHKKPQEEAQSEEVKAKVCFDIDSFLGFASSLAVAKKGLLYQPAPHMKHNISTDVHLKSQVFIDETSRSHLAMLKDIPHFLLGRFYGSENITVHILCFKRLQICVNDTRTTHLLARSDLSPCSVQAF